MRSKSFRPGDRENPYNIGAKNSKTAMVTAISNQLRRRETIFLSSASVNAKNEEIRKDRSKEVSISTKPPRLSSLDDIRHARIARSEPATRKKLIAATIEKIYH